MTTSTITFNSEPQALAVGLPIPPNTAHAISVSFPTWGDNVDYQEGAKRLTDVQLTGYPRFFIHLSVQKLAKICEQKFGMPGEQCLLCPTITIAQHCRDFLIDRATLAGTPFPVRIVQFTIFAEEGSPAPPVELDIVFFPSEHFPLARQFWQHTGLCISSRHAERCLSHLGEDPADPSYVEERFDRNMLLESAAEAKRALCRRIAGALARDSSSDWQATGGHDTQLAPSTRRVTEEDVYLYATGMAAIWSSYQLARRALPPAKSICFGFPYVDSLKCLEKWGPGCYHFGHGSDEEIDEVEALLERESQKSSGRPILLLTTEFPSNPLLHCIDLPRLRKLADRYDFLLIVDETIGTFVNVEVLPYTDIVVSSLSKIFSGAANVTGGSLVLNPKGRHYSELKMHMTKMYEDSYFDEDAIVMERNSRDFRRRIQSIDANALALCEFLHARSLAAPSPPPGAAIKAVYYPSLVSSHNYDKCRVRTADGGFAGGYGYLFSMTFTTLAASRAFFDALPFFKGPSLGTNFTLACPYTILAHYAELDWASRWGVEEGIVRVSVGMEDRQWLLRGLEKAVLAAEATMQTS